MSANNFGTFLSTVNLGSGSASPLPLPSPSPSPSTEVSPNIEPLAKRALVALQEKTITSDELREQLKLSPDLTGKVLDYLEKSDMIVRSDNHANTKIQLTDFASDALQVFNVA